MMGLYWKDIEIVPGMLLEVEHYHYEVFNSNGKPSAIRWKILGFDSRQNDQAYLEYTTGRKYSLKKVVKSRRLQTKLRREELLQIPACSDFMVVQEYHDGKEAYKRCYNLDMLSTVRDLRLVTGK